MNWSRGKNIIILVLAATNIILLYMCNVVEFKMEDNSKSFNEYLRSQSVYLKADISSQSVPRASLFVSCEYTDEEELKERIKMFDKKNIYNKIKAEKTADELISFLGYKTISCKKDKTVKIDGKGNFNIIYKSIYSGIRLEESYMIVKIRSGTIESVERKWLEPIREGETKIKTISNLTAVVRFIEKQRNNKMEGKLYIDDIKQVYWLNESNRAKSEARFTEDTMVPAWEISYNGGKKEYIEAYVRR